MDAGGLHDAGPNSFASFASFAVKNEKAAYAWPPSTNFLAALQHLHVLCLPPLRAFDDVELHRLAFFQTAETIRLNSREVNEHIFSIFAGNKAIAFRVIEPLHCALFHVIHAFLVSEICAF